MGRTPCRPRLIQGVNATVPPHILRRPDAQLDFLGTLAGMRSALPLRHRPWLARVLLACLCLAVLAPTVSRLIQSARGVPVWQVVCRSDGSAQAVKLMQVSLAGGAANATPDHGNATHQSDCPVCVWHQVAWAAAGAASLTVLDPGLRHVRPVLFCQAPAPLHAWAAPLSRGPPSQA
jgi:hypothetical protein